MIYRFGDCVLDEERYELQRAGAVVALEPKVLQVLLPHPASGLCGDPGRTP